MGLHQHGTRTITERLHAALTELIGEVNRLNATVKELVQNKKDAS